MEGHLLLAIFRKYRIELKYLAITALLLILLWYLGRSDALRGLQDATEDMLNWVANEEGLISGAIGLFLIGLISNTSLLVQVPYTVPLIQIALVTDSLLKLVLLSIAIGIGAGLGEINSYIIARAASSPISKPEDSSFFRWTNRTVNNHPRSIPLIVFFGAATPLPDDVIIWPLAIVKYPVRKVLLPMFVGKIIHNFAFAIVAFWGIGLTDTDNATVRVDLSIGILIVFILVIMYQIEKARFNRRNNQKKERLSDAVDAAD